MVLERSVGANRCIAQAIGVDVQDCSGQRLDKERVIGTCNGSVEMYSGFMFNIAKRPDNCYFYVPCYTLLFLLLLRRMRRIFRSLCFLIFFLLFFNTLLKRTPCPCNSVGKRVGVVVVVAVAAVKAVVVVAGEKKDRDGEAVERWRWRGEDEENQERRVDLLRTARKNIVVVLSERNVGKSEGLVSSI